MGVLSAIRMDQVIIIKVLEREVGSRVFGTTRHCRDLVRQSMWMRSWGRVGVMNRARSCLFRMIRSQSHCKRWIISSRMGLVVPCGGRVLVIRRVKIG